MAGIERQVFAVVAASQLVPLPMIDVPDNITAPVIGPKNFRKYCLPLYNEFAEMLADAGTLVYVHMDGDLKPLWKLIGESGVRGIDSLSPPPDNDTSVGQAHACGPRCASARTSLRRCTSRSRSSLCRARRILDEGGHSGRLQIQVSENVPPGVWRTSYPEIVAAVRDFGAPLTR